MEKQKVKTGETGEGRVTWTEFLALASSGGGKLGGPEGTRALKRGRERTENLRGRGRVGGAGKYRWFR